MRFNSIIATLALGLAATLGLVIFFSQRAAAPKIPDDKLIIAATIFPLADIAQNVGGENVHVIQLLPAGATPHSHNFAPNQLAQLQQAQALFAIGHNLDNWATAPATAAGIPVIIADQGITLREFGTDHEHEHEDDTDSLPREAPSQTERSGDPHYWLTTPNAKQIAQTISDKLQELDPRNSTNYKLLTTNYLAELDALETELQLQASTARKKEFMAIHNAWSYFANQYGLQLVATYEPIEGRTPTIADLQKFQQLVTEHDIDTFFTEPQKQTSGAARFLQDELGLNIKILDPIGGIAPRDSYINLLRANLSAITQQ